MGWEAECPGNTATGLSHWEVAFGSCEELVEQSNPNLKTANTMSGRTPLFRAAENGHEEVVRVLLERNDVNIDAVDRYGQTPLCVAAQRGHKGVVRILAEQSDASLNVAGGV